LGKSSKIRGIKSLRETSFARLNGVIDSIEIIIEGNKKNKGANP
jgi:hypothetical protein